MTEPSPQVSLQSAYHARHGAIRRQRCLSRPCAPAYRWAAGRTAGAERPVLFSERGGGLSPATVRLWFHRLYTSLKMDGCSSHSGRRTFITRAARKVSQVGGSLRDVQELAGHTSLAMTQRYIEGDTEAKRKLVALL